MSIALSFTRETRHTYEFKSPAEMAEFIRTHQASGWNPRPVPSREQGESTDDYVSRLTDHMDDAVLTQCLMEGAEVEDESFEVVDWDVDEPEDD